MAIKNKKDRKHQKNTVFFQKWNAYPQDIADQENTTIDAIHMRVRNFGSPWQRRAKPSKAEVIHRKTIREISEELNMHPISVAQRLTLTGNCYQTPKGYTEHWMIGRRTTAVRKTNQYTTQKEWIMAEHPLYAEWKAGTVDAESVKNYFVEEQNVEKA